MRHAALLALVVMLMAADLHLEADEHEVHILPESSEPHPAEVRELYALNDRARAVYAAKRYREGAALYLQVATARLSDWGLYETLSTRVNALYQSACELALAGDREAALARLRQAIACGYVRSEHIASDTDWLALHGDPAFDALVERAKDCQYKPASYEGLLVQLSAKDGAPYSGTGLSILWREVTDERPIVTMLGLAVSWNAADEEVTRIFADIERLTEKKERVAILAVPGLDGYGVGSSLEVRSLAVAGAGTAKEGGR